MASKHYLVALKIREGSAAVATEQSLEGEPWKCWDRKWDRGRRGCPSREHPLGRALRFQAPPMSRSCSGLQGHGVDRGSEERGAAGKEDKK